MTKTYKLSLPAVILINLNIIVGVGLFINTTELAKRAGILGTLSYAVVGILLLPLLLSIVRLLWLYPAGGFYAFGSKVIHPFVGFVSTWSYFIGKLASTALVIHTFVLLMQEAIPFLKIFDPLFLDFITLITLSLFNLLNIKTGSLIQTGVMTVKMMPILFIIIVGLFFMQPTNLVLTKPVMPSIIDTLPLVLYAMIGFEAACSLSAKIKGAQKNAPLAVLISYGLVVIFYCLYQLIFYGVLGNTLAQQVDYKDAFPTFVYHVLPHVNWLTSSLIFSFHIAIAISALGAAYGILYSNMWNLYILAKHNHTFSIQKLTSVNSHQIPFFCVMIEALLCFLYLLITHGNQFSLQKIGAFGITITYLLSTLSLFIDRYRKQQSLLLPFCGIINCIVLLIACINSFFETGFIDLLIFFFFWFFGIFMFWYREKQPKNINAIST